MIYINLSNTSYTPNQNWSDKSLLLKNQLLALSEIEDINAIIDANVSLWSEIKDSFPYCNKCWISEAKESVSPYTIEHFRPKKMVSKTNFKRMGLETMLEAQRVDWIKSTRYRGVGYWWLAFDYTNFRICGSIINSIKSNRFPLKVGSYIALSNNDNHNNEDSILLDPTKKGDPELLTFDSTGKALPTETDFTKYEYIRALISIEIYGLNKIPPLVEHRLAKWNDCIELIKDNLLFYNQIKPLIENNQNLPDNLVVIIERFNKKYNTLKKYISPDSEFSAVAKTCLLSYSSTNTWINDYVFN